MSAAVAAARPRLAIVTAAAAGIGRAITESFLARGYACLALDRNGEELAALRADVAGEHGDRLRTIAVDLLSDELGAVAAAIATYEGYSLHLVNNLGGSSGPKRALEALEWSDFAATLQFNLRATVEMTRIVLPAMRAQRRGWIVNIGSMAGRAAFDYVGADYAAAKAALLGLTRTMASELVSAGILVNTICPGIIATARINRRWAARTPSENQAVLSTIPVGRLGSPEDIAKACMLLGSEANEYITGAVLDVNGGAFVS
jgi:NAD(P)-dependent dehydrogenase (short-subunit alcohol dehydrogenase family)